MPALSGKEADSIFQRYQIAKDRVALWREELEAAYFFSQPWRNLYSWSLGETDAGRKITEGQAKNNQLYDTTLLEATTNLVSKLHGGLTPPYTHWTSFVPGPEIDSAQKAVVRKSLKKVTEVFFKYLQQSNFNMAVSEAYYDLVIGTAALHVRSGGQDKPLIFTAVPIIWVYPEESPSGDIDTVFRDVVGLPIRDVDRLFPGASLSPQSQNKLVQNPNSKIELIEGTIYNPKAKNYRYVVIEKQTKWAIIDNELDSSPWIVWRWLKAPGELLGRGPVLDARPSASTANEMMRDELAAAAFQAGPIWMAYSAQAFNPYNFMPKPNSVFVVGEMPGAPAPIQQVPVQSNLQFMQLSIQDLRQAIMRMMFNDPIRQPGSPAETATETLYKQQVALERQGPAISRQLVEFLPKVVKRVLFLLRQEKLMEDIKVDGKVIDLEYNAPLAQIQNNSDINAYTRYNQILQLVLGPELSLGVQNLSELPEWLAEKLGIDPALVKSKVEIDEIIQRITQAASGPQQPSEPPQFTPTA